MPFNGSGVYNPVAAPYYPAVSGTTILAAQYNAQISDMATALSTCITKDGQTTITANIPFSTYRITGLGDPSGVQDAATKNYCDTTLPTTFPPRKNAIINGKFDLWQQATGLTDSGFSADRWNTSRTGSTVVVSQQAFTAGQTSVPYEPSYYHRTVVTSVAGAGNYVLLQQAIEGVRTFAGQQITVSFYAQVDTNKNIAVELLQYFGSTGSTAVSTSVTTKAITTTWAKYTITTTLSSISGKTIAGVNDALRLVFWFDAGATYNARTNSLGQQSGTFDIAEVQVEAGPAATPIEWYSPADNLARCERYCEKSYNTTVIPGATSTVGEAYYIAPSTVIAIPITFSVVKYATPTLTFYSPATGTSGKARDVTAAADVTVTSGGLGGQSGATCYANSGITAGHEMAVHWLAVSELV